MLLYYLIFIMFCSQFSLSKIFPSREFSGRLTWSLTLLSTVKPLEGHTFHLLQKKAFIDINYRLIKLPLVTYLWNTYRIRLTEPSKWRKVSHLKNDNVHQWNLSSVAFTIDSVRYKIIISVAFAIIDRLWQNMPQVSFVTDRIFSVRELRENQRSYQQMVPIWPKLCEICPNFNLAKK